MLSWFSHILPIDQKREFTNILQCDASTNHNGSQRIIGDMHIEFGFLGYSFVKAPQGCPPAGEV